MNAVNWQEDLEPSDESEVDEQTERGGVTVYGIRAGRFVRRVFLACIALEILIVLLDGFLHYGRLIGISQIRRIFNIAEEVSIGTWFSVTQSFLVGAVAILVLLSLRASGASRFKRIGWAVIAAFFIFMSIDDAAKVHERVGSGVKSYHNDILQETGKMTAGARFFQKWPTYSWQIVVAPFYGVVGLFLLFFLWKDFPQWSARLALLLGFGCWGLAVGVDFVEGLDGVHDKVAEFCAVRTYTIMHFSKSAEEFIEMLGTTLFLVTFLERFTEENQVMTIRFLK